MTKNPDYVSTTEAGRLTGLCSKTIIELGEQQKLNVFKTNGGHRRYLVSDLKKYSNKESTTKPWYVIYTRVSSQKQFEDLARQTRLLQKTYPHYDVISDVGSGINFRRKGLRSIFDKALDGYEIHLAIAHKDRLARFGFELIEYVVNQTGGEIICLDDTKQKSREEELAEDLLAIIQVFNCRFNGRRRYSKANNNGTPAVTIDEENKADDETIHI